MRDLPITASILCTRVNLRACSLKRCATVEIANKFVQFFLGDHRQYQK